MNDWLVASSSSTAAKSSYELNRDLLVWLCVDHSPFNTVTKPGFIEFNKKNIQWDLPTDKALSTTCLIDVYSALKEEVKKN
jgi:hypothetical protein